MVKLKYLRHPLETAKTAGALFEARLNMWKFANHGKHRFKDDARYDLQNVIDGFASRIDDSSSDGELLERICTAYIKTIEQQQSSPKVYEATEWWQQIRSRNLAPAMQALLTRNIGALRKMYSNFFRDSCSSGLLGAPYGMSKAYFGGKIKKVHSRFYLGHVLYRLDYWMMQTNGQFTLRNLSGPGIGNPFGLLIDGTHIGVGAEYAHYCATKVNQLLDHERNTVVEIGGGFGGMAYYLLRDSPNVKYLDFDVPESIALTSYYLLKAFPHLKFLLFGEKKLTKEAIARADVLLMPVFELQRMPAESASVTFSSHSMSDIGTKGLVEYLNQIDRITQNNFLYLGNQRASMSIVDLMARDHSSFRLSESNVSGWHSHKISGAGVGGAAGLAASTMIEQCYVRDAATPSMLA